MDFYVKTSEGILYFDEANAAKTAFLESSEDAIIGITAEYEDDGILDVYIHRNGAICYTDNVDAFDVWDFDDMGNRTRQLFGELREAFGGLVKETVAKTIDRKQPAQEPYKLSKDFRMPGMERIKKAFASKDSDKDFEEMTHGEKILESLKEAAAHAKGTKMLRTQKRVKKDQPQPQDQSWGFCFAHRLSFGSSLKLDTFPLSFFCGASLLLLFNLRKRKTPEDGLCQSRAGGNCF